MKLFLLTFLSLNLLALEVTINSSLSEKEIQDIQTNILKNKTPHYDSNTWTDPLSDLTWQDDQRQPREVSFSNATEYCENLTLKSFTDWRLPTSNELTSLIDYTQSSPQVRSGLKYISTIAYISSTKYHKQTWSTEALTTVNFDNATVDYYQTKQGYLISVRCVRNHKND